MPKKNVETKPFPKVLYVVIEGGFIHAYERMESAHGEIAGVSVPIARYTLDAVGTAKSEVTADFKKIG